MEKVTCIGECLIDMKKIILARPFQRCSDDDRGLLDLAFSKKKADERKDWLKTYEAGTFLDNQVSRISISEFVNKELILHSMADNVRSIPNVIDGFKPGHRKILFACIKRNLVKGELKVIKTKHENILKNLLIINVLLIGRSTCRLCL